MDQSIIFNFVTCGWLILILAQPYSPWHPQIQRENHASIKGKWGHPLKENRVKSARIDILFAYKQHKTPQTHFCFQLKRQNLFMCVLKKLKTNSVSICRFCQLLPGTNINSTKTSRSFIFKFTSFLCSKKMLECWWFCLNIVE